MKKEKRKVVSPHLDWLSDIQLVGTGPSMLAIEGQQSVLLVEAHA